jgi:hypothetical protein
MTTNSAEAAIEKIAVILHKELRAYEDPYDRIYHNGGQIVSELPEEYVGFVRFDGVILQQADSKPSWDFFYRRLATKIHQATSEKTK